MPSIAAFRHDPVKSVLWAGEPGRFHWDREPAVCGYRMLTYQSASVGRAVPVPVSATPAVITGVGVCVASDDGYVRLHNTGLTKVYWERRMNSGVYASLVVDAGRGRVIAAATSGLVACFDVRGALVWSADVGAPVFATPTVLSGGDVLVIATFHSNCVGVDLESGALVFQRKLPEPWHAACNGSASYRDPYASPAATDAGTAIICCAEHVLCLAPDGTELWRQVVGHGIKASPVTLHETGGVAVCPVDGRCVFLDSRTGDLRGELFLGSKVTTSPAVSGTVLAVGTSAGSVFGLDVRSCDVIWTAGQGAPRSYTSFSVLPPGDFIATSERGNVVCLRRDDGRFQWETSQVMGLPEHDPAMDITPVAGPDGTMYCASYSGVVYEFNFRPAAEEEMPCR